MSFRNIKLVSPSGRIFLRKPEGIQTLPLLSTLASIFFVKLSTMNRLMILQLQRYENPQFPTSIIIKYLLTIYKPFLAGILRFLTSYQQIIWNKYSY